MHTTFQLHTDSVLYHHNTDRMRSDEYWLHCHHYYEIYYFIKGDVSYLVEGRRYVPAPHSILLISPNVFHGVRIESENPYERFALHFVPGILSLENRGLLLSPFHQTDIYYRQVDSFGMQDYFEQLMECRNMSEDLKDLSIKIRLEALLSQLLFMCRTMKGDSPEAGHPHTVSRVLAYLNENMTGPISLDDLASRFFVSKHHLNKIFRKATGTTVGNYVIRKRVALAQQLMMRGQSAVSASASAGFQDYSSFFRAYKNVFGHAPTEKRSPILLR